MRFCLDLTDLNGNRSCCIITNTVLYVNNNNMTPFKCKLATESRQLHLIAVLMLYCRNKVALNTTTWFLSVSKAMIVHGARGGNTFGDAAVSSHFLS